MGDKSAIEWTSATWNPVRGCSRVSEGCRHCYAEIIAARFSGPGKPYEGLARRRRVVEDGTGKSGTVARWTGEVRFVEEALSLPLRWKSPRRIFVNSMSDLFHEKVEDAWIDRIFAVMALASQHTFQVLTKRAELMARHFSDPTFRDRVARAVGSLAHHGLSTAHWSEEFEAWPLPNVHLGVSVEDQTTADERIPLLLQTSAAVRWVSYEPALEPVDFHNFLPRVIDTDDGGNDLRLSGLDWLVIGGESGSGARPFDCAWARSVIAQCREAGVPVFVKQLGAVPVGSVLYNATWPAHVRVGWSGAGLGTYRVQLRDRKGGDPQEWPADLRVREFPHSPTGRQEG